MNIQFLSTVAVIAPDPPARRKLYVHALGLPLESHGDDLSPQPADRRLQVVRHLAGVPGRRGVLRDIAMAGREAGPQVSIEFDVADAAAVRPAARELEQAGYELPHSSMPSSTKSSITASRSSTTMRTLSIR